MKTFVFSLILGFVFVSLIQLCCGSDIRREIETITEYYANYPEAELDQLDLWKYEFDTQQIKTGKGKRSAADNNQEDFLIEAKLCESKIVFTRPKRLKNLDDKVQTIVNHRNYTQFVRFEECDIPSFPCTRDIYPFNVRSFCQQNYHKVNLLAYDEEIKCLVEDDFIVPSTCDCMIDKGDLLRGVHKNILSGKA